MTSHPEPQLLVKVCGEWKPCSMISDTETLAEVAIAEKFSRELIQKAITFEFRLPKYFRCSSRKRLIKLLMANKIDRDSAERMAWIVCASRMSYQEAWRQIWPQLISQ